MSLQLVNINVMDYLVKMIRSSKSLRSLYLALMVKSKIYDHLLDPVKDRLIFLSTGKDCVERLLNMIPFQVHYFGIRVKMITENEDLPLMEEVRRFGKLDGFYRKFIQIHSFGNYLNVLNRTVLGSKTLKFRKEYMDALLRYQLVGVNSFHLFDEKHPGCVDLLISQFDYRQIEYLKEVQEYISKETFAKILSREREIIELMQNE